MTYLQLVNSVLTRLRESTVSGVNENDYSRMIGEFVNDAKREVEDAYNWAALRTTASATTVADIFSYELNGSSTRFRLLTAINDTSNHFLEQRSSTWFDNQFLNETPVKGSPYYFTYNGVSTDGDTLVEVYPIPDGAYTLRFNIVKPQAQLSDDADSLLIPSQPVILGAYARALIERGEDGGLATNEAAVIYQASLSDHIAIEAGHYPSELDWNVT
jgi:hypothetical protein